MRGKVCLVTGGTSGVGRAMARGLARLGATVVITSRDPDRGRHAAEAIRAWSNNPRVSVLPCDLSSLASVRAAAHAFLRDYDRLHVVSHNAALLLPRRELTREGIERMFAVNHLGPYLLTRLLWDRLRESAPARILSVGGRPGPFRWARIELDNLQGERRFTPLRHYLNTMLHKLAFTFEAARWTPETGITANAFYPGLIKSGLTRHLPGWARLAAAAGQALFSEHTVTGVYLASAPEVAETSGRLFVGWRPVRFPAQAQCRAQGPALWDASARLAGLDP